MFLSRQQQVMESFVRRLMHGYRLHPEARAAIMTYSRAVHFLTRTNKHHSHNALMLRSSLRLRCNPNSQIKREATSAMEGASATLP